MDPALVVRQRLAFAALAVALALVAVLGAFAGPWDASSWALVATGAFLLAVAVAGLASLRARR